MIKDDQRWWKTIRNIHGFPWLPHDFPMVSMVRGIHEYPISIMLDSGWWSPGNGSITQFPILTMPNDARSLWKHPAGWDFWDEVKPPTSSHSAFFFLISCLRFFAMLPKSSSQGHYTSNSRFDGLHHRGTGVVDWRLLIRKADPF